MWGEGGERTLGPSVSGNIVGKEKGTEIEGEGRAVSGGPKGRGRLSRLSHDSWVQLPVTCWEELSLPATFSSLSSGLFCLSLHCSQAHTGFIFTFLCSYYALEYIYHCTYRLLYNVYVAISFDESMCLGAGFGSHLSRSPMASTGTQHMLMLSKC